MKLIVANFTAFTQSGDIHLDAMRQHAQYLIASGVDGFAPTGTTGQFLYLSFEEKRKVHALMSTFSDSVEVLPCIWAPSHGQMANLAQACQADGAHAVFTPPPLYHVVSDDDILRWYEAVTDVVDIPVYAYHHPRTHNPISADLLDRLISELGISGMKDSSGDLARVSQLAKRFPNKILSSDHFFGKQKVIGEIQGFVSRFANIYPTVSRKIINGETPLSEMARLDAPFKAAGGAAAYPSALGFHPRAPIASTSGKPVPVAPHWTY
jgi:dihydrodipicolinate synthase/N-acetylneuraminate lyase